MFTTIDGIFDEFVRVQEEPSNRERNHELRVIERKLEVEYRAQASEFADWLKRTEDTW